MDAQQQQHNVIEIALTKIVDIATTIAENNGQIKALISNLEKDLPDNKDVKKITDTLEEMKASIGRSDSSIVYMIGDVTKTLSTYKPVLDKVGNLETLVDKLEHAIDTDFDGHFDDANTSRTYIDILSKHKYSENDLNRLGQLVSQINDMHKHVLWIKKWGGIIAGVFVVLGVLFKIFGWTKIFGV